MSDELAKLVARTGPRKTAAWNAIAAWRRAMAFEDALKTAAGWFTAMGAGHYPTVPPTLEDIAATLVRGDGGGSSPRCRYCGVPVASITGAEPCPGDTRRCHVQIPKSTTEEGASFQRYMVDAWLCGRPGKFVDGFTRWNCTVGHATLREAAGRWKPVLCTACTDLGCLGDCPGNTLATVGEPAPSIEAMTAEIARQYRERRPRRRDDRATVERIYAHLPLLTRDADTVRRLLAGDTV